MEGIAEVEGQQFDTNYMNWLVGNGFVITTGYGDERLDHRAKVRLQRYFPDRDIYAPHAEVMGCRRCALPHQRPASI